MIKKTYAKSKQSCRVTFELPGEVDTKTAYLRGEFNEWDPEANPMQRRKKDGAFTLTLSLKPEREYRFRYLLDGKRWENDWAADAYVPNSFGGEDSVVQV